MKIHRSAALIAAGVLSAGVLAAAPASAAPVPGSVPATTGSAAAAWACASGYSCFYDGRQGQNRFYVAPSCGLFELGRMTPARNDRLGSVRNRTKAPVYLFDYVGDAKYVQVGKVAANTRVTLPASVNNRVDAVFVVC
ncbi:peptidase inhibitor family I36 protein [Bailinhaonella thermotolerans]|uniref:Peptidase inhibitor family I36 n=1 Tax=Bailinhaonella thermotolerans TaxID=1070861 RepID=A0A3A4B5Y9_9ACTN|nr:peptidase inhibitor family I36 protein [Bailinhaonella thermotolerans]RJL33977.1 hypothetical protein D5H75_05470 [Bailinhaonella thermotolerans]